MVCHTTDCIEAREYELCQVNYYSISQLWKVIPPVEAGIVKSSGQPLPHSKCHLISHMTESDIKKCLIYGFLPVHHQRGLSRWDWNSFMRQVDEVVRGRNRDQDLRRSRNQTLSLPPSWKSAHQDTVEYSVAHADISMLPPSTIHSTHRSHSTHGSIILSPHRAW